MPSFLGCFKNRLDNTHTLSPLLKPRVFVERRGRVHLGGDVTGFSLSYGEVEKQSLPPSQLALLSGRCGKAGVLRPWRVAWGSRALEFAACS